MKTNSLLSILILITIIVIGQNNKNIVFYDDFEIYNPGEQLACENPDDWTTWTNSPCGSEDAYISDIYAYGGTNSVNIVEDNDLVYELDNYLTNNYCWVNMMIYVPNGNSAYYNVQSNFNGGANPEWAFEIFFNPTGDGYLNAGGYYATTFDYATNTWLASELFIDIDNDLAQYYLDGNIIYEWEWSLGATGNGSQMQIAAINFYGFEGTTSYYIDDFKVEGDSWGCLTKPTNLIGPDYVAIGENINLSWDFPDSGKCPDLNYNTKYFEYFNIYRDGLVIGTSTELEYTDIIDITGNYTYCVTAVYDIGESECSNSILVFVAEQLNPPLNLTGFIDDNDVTLNWDAPSGGNGDPQWIQWDSGENTGNGIGLTNGGTFMVASRWMQNELVDFDGMSVTEMSFFANDDPDATYVLKIWTGFDASIEVMSQTTTFDVDEFNIITLDNPVTIDANMQYWFGYEITHDAGSFPAGADDGPAVQESGDMISLDGVEWVGMSATYGLDYNWNIAVYVDNNKNGSPPIPIKKSISPVSSDSFVASGTTGIKQTFNPPSAKELTGYNVYRNGEVIGTTDETTYTDYNLEPGTYEYCITAVYDEGESECSNTFTIVGPNPLLPPTNFTGPSEVFFGEPFCFTWDAPGYGEWIHWDTGENTGNGIAAGDNFFVASHWMPSDIEAFQGFFLTKIAFFPVGATDAVFTLKVWKGPNAEIELMSQDIQAFTVDSWNEINLSNPIVIEASTEYWFGYEVSYTPGSFPAGCDDGPAIQGSGDMISINGVDWVSMSEAYGLDYNWNLHVYLSYNGKAGTLLPISKNSVPKSYVGTIVPALQNTNLNSSKVVFKPKNINDLLYYNLYRNGILIGNTDCDTLFSSGTYTYCVTAVYDEGESICSNDWIIDLSTGIGEDQFNNIQIFPNPASSIVNIKSEIQISSINIFNYAGQIIRNEKVDRKFYQINTSQFEAGIYFFRLETEKGVVSERIVVQ